LLHWLCDESVAQAEGGRADLDMYIYREGFYRGLGLSLWALLLALLARALVPGATFAPGGTPEPVLTTALLFFGVLCAAAALLSFVRRSGAHAAGSRIRRKKHKELRLSPRFHAWGPYHHRSLSQASRSTSLRQEVRASWMRSRRTSVPSSKDLRYYLSLPYTIQLTHEADGWFAEIAELPGCMTQGNSAAEAVEKSRTPGRMDRGRAAGRQAGSSAAPVEDYRASSCCACRARCIAIWCARPSAMGEPQPVALTALARAVGPAAPPREEQQALRRSVAQVAPLLHVVAEEEPDYGGKAECHHHDARQKDK